jgi:hypothetical protein
VLIALVLGGIAASMMTTATAGALQPPANDNYLDATNLNAPGQRLSSAVTFADTGNTIGASVQTDVFSRCGLSICPAGPAEATSCSGVRYGKTVWYDFYPKQDGQIEIRTAGFPNVIALYSYSARTLLPNALQCAPGSSYPSNVLVAPVHGGVDYTFQIGGRGTAGGIFQVLFNYADRTHLSVAPFLTKARAQFIAAQPGYLRLLSLRFIGLARGEKVSVACAFCQPGSFGTGVTQGNTVLLKAISAPIIGPQTRLIVGATSPAQIGRFKLYTLDAAIRDLRLIRQGCLAPGVTHVSSAGARTTSAIKHVPCPVTLFNPVGAEYVFWEGRGDRLWEQWYSGTRWSRPLRLKSGSLRSGPAVAVHADGQQDVFWEGAHGELRETYYTGQWHGPITLGGGLASAPTVGTDSAQNEYVFWEGTDHGLWEAAYSTGIWSAGRLGVGILGSAPAVAVHPDGDQDVFWRGTNGDLWEMSYTDRWSAPIDRGGGPLGTGPSVAIDGSGNEYVVWRDVGGGLVEKRFSHGVWAAPVDLVSGRLGSAPTIAVHANGEQDVFWSGFRGDLWETWYTNRWNGPVKLRAHKLRSSPAAGVDAAGKQGTV